MVENSYQSIEFDYAPAADQLEARRVRAAVTIQRQWRSVCAMMRLMEEAAARRVSDAIHTPPGVAVGEAVTAAAAATAAATPGQN